MKKWNYHFEVPARKKVRVIVHTDCKNEADDQFALAHHLMTDKFIVTGIVAAHFNQNPKKFGEGNTAKASEDEINKILKLMKLDDEYKVYRGAEYPLENETTPREAAGVDYIIEEAMKDDKRPLFIACLGGITDLASAIIKKPEICERMTVIWIGGGNYPKGGWEFNQHQDVAAANVVMKSKMPVWQITKNCYKQNAVTLTELQLNVEPCGEIGKYLFEQMVEINNECADYEWPHGEVWGLGDSPTVGVLLMESERDDVYDIFKAPTISYEDESYSFSEQAKDIRVYNFIDSRLTLSDFFAKLKINYGS